MPADSNSDLRLEIAHVLFIDIVGYSRLLINEQREALAELNNIVRNSDTCSDAEAAHQLTRIPTGDGMALVFSTTPDAPVECALEVSKALKSRPEIPVRMGIHSGPISAVTDVNDCVNIAGGGINMAQRVMDCGDAGHILLSKHVADDLEHYPRWQPYLHSLGECEVKHGARIGLVNLCKAEIGNPAMPSKLQAVQQHRARKRWTAIAATVFLLIALVAASVIVSRRSAAIAISDKSIAVLPFENLSKDEDNAYFAGGVQDEILSDLAKVADLKVISRTSVMKYKSGPERNLREIAKILGVSHVVEGSVQRTGDRIRVNAQLIDARNDAHVWAEHYDRDLADIFAVQSEVAQRIADQLRAKISAVENAAITERPTADLVAYAYYTKAKELDLSDNWEGNEKNLNGKIELLEKATQRDPSFALAYCALATTHLDLGSQLGDPHAQLELAKKAAETAARVRPDLGEAHLALASYYFFAGVFTYNYEQARQELAIVGRKLPNNAEALVIGAMIGRHENRWDEALADLQKANELDPNNYHVAQRLWQIYFEMRRYSQAEQFGKQHEAKPRPDPADQTSEALLKLAEGEPEAAQSILDQVPLDFSPSSLVWSTRFTAALYRRDYGAASRVIAATPAKWVDLLFFDLTMNWAEGQIARAQGNTQAAQAAFAAARQKMQTKFDDKPKDADAGYWSQIAILDAGLGRKEEAIREARRAVEILPISKDAVNGPWNISNLALVYAWTGEKNLAFEQLEKAATIPGALDQALTYGDLRFNPCWDDLRSDPRFDGIVAACKAASK